MTDQARLDAIRNAGEISAAGLDYLERDARMRREETPLAPPMPQMPRGVWLPIDHFDKEYFLALDPSDGYGVEKILLYGTVHDDDSAVEPIISTLEFLYRHFENEEDIRFSSGEWDGMDGTVDIVPSQFMIVEPPALPFNAADYPSPYYRDNRTKIISIRHHPSGHRIWNYNETKWETIDDETLAKLKDEQHKYLAVKEGQADDQVGEA